MTGRVDVDACVRLHAMHGEMTAKRARAGNAVECADEMPRDGVKPRAARQLIGDIRHHRFQ